MQTLCAPPLWRPNMVNYQYSPNKFFQFMRLPIELRCQIWSYASFPRATRILQVFYQPELNIWRICKDSCGGLPINLILVGKEARAEVLKPYKRAFGTWIDFEEDIIFISDPFFSIRDPRKAFLDSEHTQSLRKIAITVEITSGIEETYETFPKFSGSFPSVLRSLKGLEHLFIAMSDDEAGLYLDFPEDSHEEYQGQYDIVPREHDVDEAIYEEETGDLHGADALDSNAEDEEEDLSGNDQEELEAEYDPTPEEFLCDQEAEAINFMSKGYYREVGDIHFEVLASFDREEQGVPIIIGSLIGHCIADKEEYPGWKIPKLTVVSVRYGLAILSDYLNVFHFEGDQKSESAGKYLHLECLRPRLPGEDDTDDEDDEDN